MAVTIYIEGEKLDLYDNESINVTTAVQNVQDISKLFTDFSQSFTVPASKRNNTIFKNYYNADINGGFDARTRKLATIDIDTLDFKRGKIELNKVEIKENAPIFYNITFFGDTIKVKDLLGDDKLFQLDWLDNFNHDYTDLKVKEGLTTGLDFTVDSVLYEKAVIYPLISYKRQYLYNSDPSDQTSTERLVNIAYDASRDDGVDYRNLKPAIKLSLIFEAITQKYGLTFTNNFFGSELFKQIYINLNNKKESLSNGNFVYESGNTGTFPNTEVFYEYRATITPLSGYENTPYKIRMKLNDQVIYESSNFLTGAQVKTVQNSVEPQFNYDFSAEIITESDFQFNAEQRLRRFILFFGWETISNNSYVSQSVDLNTIIVDNLKDIKVYDFLNAIIRMFNLVITPEGEDLYVNDLNSWYSEGQIYDITPYVDTTKETVSKGKLYNQINFKFKESDQILANFFEQSNNITYGNLEQRIEDESGELINGSTLDVETIFENPIFERLFDLENDTETNIQYGLMLNENLEAFVGEPFLFYAPSVSISSNSIGFKGLNTYEEINGNVLMPSHSMQIDTSSFNLNFNAEINEYTSEVFTDTIYQRFYSDYIGDIFNVKRRLYNYNAILPLNLLHNLKPNDRLIIEDRRYIQNTITSDLVNRSDKLELINDIFDSPLASDSLNTSVFERVSGLYSYKGAEDSVKYIGLDDKTVTKEDVGYGTSWVSVTNPKSVGSVSNIDFTVDSNNTGLDRSMVLRMNDGLNNPTFTILQLSGNVTWDNNTITWDNNIITWDNN